MEPQFVTFEAKFEPAPPGTPATPRPAHRPRDPVTEVPASALLHSFECESVPPAEGTPATPRPANRPREAPGAAPPAPEFHSFECESVPLAEGTPATPRPADRPREAPTPPTTDAEEAFARELAERVLEYVRNRPAGRSAEQLAALVQQLLARRSA